MRIALVHDWLTGMRGGEKVLSHLCRLFPQADLLTLIHVPGTCHASIERMPIISTFLNDLPAVRYYYRYLLPLMPLAVECLDVTGYDLIISSSHCVAKGIIPSPSALHICYCHTPMRYVWDQQKIYTDSLAFSGLTLKAIGGYLRAWDLRSARRVDYFLANSRNVAQRIRRSYHRQAEVIYPPVDTEFFTLASHAREDFYLMVTALAPYKRVDQAIQAFANLGRPLKVIGSGQQLAKFRRQAPKNVEFLGWQSNEMVRDCYRKCRALVFPGEEDFGIVPLEAMACGAAVIAYAAGGALETVVDVSRGSSSHASTGLLYAPQTAEGLASAIKKFEQMETRFEPEHIVTWAQQFAPVTFIRNFKASVAVLLKKKGLTVPW